MPLRFSPAVLLPLLSVEAVIASTVTTSTVLLKQGSTSVAGTVSLQRKYGHFHTFCCPGFRNCLYSDRFGSKRRCRKCDVLPPKPGVFTTAAALACGSGTQSFATNVFPIVQNKCMPCHSGSSPSGGISLTNYTQVKAIGSRLDNSTMYGKMGVTTWRTGHYQSMAGTGFSE